MGHSVEKEKVGKQKAEGGKHRRREGGKMRR